MTDVYDYLRGHLEELAAPYLFIGSGLSRRYAQLPSWEELLRNFCTPLKQPFEYYRGLSENDLPKAATAIAKDFYDIWWLSDEFENSRTQHRSLVTDPSLPLKIEIANSFEAAVRNLTIPEELEKEFDLFKKVTVDGIITTNYDRLLSTAFPTFTVFTGQDELLLADPHGIAEIYQIHGSSDSPSTLILTEEDYNKFAERDAYLAAKLMTIFVEHPVIFLGYSMSDPNILQILNSILKALPEKHQDYLKKRLIFVRWDATCTPRITTRTMQVGEASLETTEISTSHFIDIFQALGARERAFPANILRHLKSQVHELVKSNDPEGRLAASTDIDSPNDKLKIVFGVAAELTTKGLVGLSRFELFEDVLNCPDRGLPARNILEETLQSAAFRRNMYVPYWKYLRNGHFLNDEGSLKTGSKIPDRIISYIERETKNLPPKGCRGIENMQDIIDTKGKDWVLTHPWELLNHTQDTEGLREFLIANKDLRSDHKTSTSYAKLVVAYDWLMYGPPHIASQHTTHKEQEHH
ncbi:MAG: SIR2 family protein [Propionibacteriaceae bacterium]|nr:SIR2 family protein [Propionibacteriaceae bacterium]